MSGKTILEFDRSVVDVYKQFGERMGGGLTNKSLFMIAMTWGFANGTRAEKVSGSNNGPRVDYLKEPDHAILAAIHLSEVKDPDLLLDLDERYTIAEQYAHGGILLIKTMMDQDGDLARMFAGEIKSRADELLEESAQA